MPETLQDVELEIEELKKDIKAIKDIPEGQRTPDEQALLVSYNQQLASLRKDKERLIEGAAQQNFKTPSPTKRSTAKQDSFKKKLQRRCPQGSNACEICSEECFALEAAHLVDHALKAQLEAAYVNDSLHLPVSANDAANGLLLCPTCHSYFDKRPPLIRVHVDGTIKLFGAAKKQNYKNLHGTKVAWADHISIHKDYPSKELLQFSSKLTPAPRKRVRELSSEEEEEEEEVEQQGSRGGRSKASAARKKK